MNNVVWEKETRRCIIQIIATSNWKSGKPIDPKIPKWLVKLNDKWIQEEYFPRDDEFPFVFSTLKGEPDSLQAIREAFEMKEKHNKANLLNPECRKIERIFGRSRSSF